MSLPIYIPIHMRKMLVSPLAPPVSMQPAMRPANEPMAALDARTHTQNNARALTRAGRIVAVLSKSTSHRRAFPSPSLHAGGQGDAGRAVTTADPLGCASLHRAPFLEDQAKAETRRTRPGR